MIAFVSCCSAVTVLSQVWVSSLGPPWPVESSLGSTRTASQSPPGLQWRYRWNFHTYPVIKHNLVQVVSVWFWVVILILIVLLLFQPYQWLREKIMSEDGRKQQAKLKELAHIAEKLGCTLPQLAIGKGQDPQLSIPVKANKDNAAHSQIQCFCTYCLIPWCHSRNCKSSSYPPIFSLVPEEWGSELSAAGILQSKPANRESGSHSGITHIS